MAWFLALTEDAEHARERSRMKRKKNRKREFKI
jgi:hypothetical protein